MNSTQTAVLDQLTPESGAMVAQLVDLLGKSETTIRKALKELAAQGEVVKKENGYWFPVVQPEPAPVAKKKYRRHETPQTRTTRINQITGYKVGVRKTSETPFKGIDEKWYAVCFEHNTAGGEAKLLDAHWLSTYPTFCPECLPLLDGKIGRRRAHGLADAPEAVVEAVEELNGERLAVAAEEE
jgi:biotin operon repressor